MSQPGGRPTGPGPADDWWGQLYDSTGDTGPAPAPDSLDDRYASAAGTVTDVPAPDRLGPGAQPPDAPPRTDGLPAPRAPWEPPGPAATGPVTFSDRPPGPPADDGSPPPAATRPAPAPPWGAAPRTGAPSSGGTGATDPGARPVRPDDRMSWWERPVRSGPVAPESGGRPPEATASGGEQTRPTPPTAPADRHMGPTAPSSPTPSSPATSAEPPSPATRTEPDAPSSSAVRPGAAGPWSSAASSGQAEPPSPAAPSGQTEPPSPAAPSGQTEPRSGSAGPSSPDLPSGPAAPPPPPAAQAAPPPPPSEPPLPDPRLPRGRTEAGTGDGRLVEPFAGPPPLPLPAPFVASQAQPAAPGHVGDGPPTYDAEPTALPAADPDGLDGVVADTVLDGARYGSATLRAVSQRGDSARYRGDPRRDALLTARFGAGPDALVLVAMATGARAGTAGHRAAAELCRHIGRAVGRSHARLAEDLRAARRGDLKSGLHRLTDRSLGRLRATAAEEGLAPDEYAAGLRCLLLPADPDCRTRVFFGVGPGGLLRLRDGAWQDLEPPLGAVAGAPVLGFGSAPNDVPSETPDGDRLTLDLTVTAPPGPDAEPPREPFRFRASVARPGDVLLLCTAGLAEPLHGEPRFGELLARRWSDPVPPGLAEFLADSRVRVKGYADDRTAAAVWEA
ncbi:protein phosphatase 2C domain-containing protein [Streptomyces sp. NPDC003717]|uniref:protein phosphatase 2C domain-containing protein n=1 Tax=Streptomyces sp. NPDC003717 TaxID=3154276 RepID=UPI0033B73B0D